MMIDCTPGQFKELLASCVKLGYQQAQMENGHIKPYVSQAEAYRIYGRRQIDRWRRQSLINRIKDGTNSSTVRYSRTELETVAMTANRIAWFKQSTQEEGFDAE